MVTPSEWEALDHHHGLRRGPQGEAPAERRCGKIKTPDLEEEGLKLDQDDLARMCAYICTGFGVPQEVVVTKRVAEMIEVGW